MADVRNLSPSYAFHLPAHPRVATAARRSFDKQVDGWSKLGADTFAAVGLVPKFAAKAVIGERHPAVARPETQHTKISFDEGAIGSTLVSIQTVLAEVGAIVGAIAGVFTAGGKAALGQSTTGTIANHARAGKNVASLAATVVTSPASVALNLTRLAVEEALKVLPVVGSIVGGGAGSVIGSVTGVLTGVGFLLGLISDTRTATPATPAVTTTTTASNTATGGAPMVAHA